MLYFITKLSCTHLYSFVYIHGHGTEQPSLAVLDFQIILELYLLIHSTSHAIMNNTKFNLQEEKSHCLCLFFFWQVAQTSQNILTTNVNFYWNWPSITVKRKLKKLHWFNYLTMLRLSRMRPLIVTKTIFSTNIYVDKMQYSSIFSIWTLYME